MDTKSMRMHPNDLTIGMQFMFTYDDGYSFEYYRYEVEELTDRVIKLQWLRYHCILYKRTHCDEYIQTHITVPYDYSVSRANWIYWIGNDVPATTRLIKQAEDRMTELLLSS